ncbi:hypothetical protein HO173_010824 [Letharia columbiana]|uniref:Uncharacterized protein n=1 Tax=Letharia columbiana TaxID=112416 RepID=A0A8H6FLU1_9LECA|nr:uncharacterized protein HO173_010824 [Letharia columbiana]KAF6230916.1 hypothetical protein HO173_010824 [Letharia columbiana]
MYPTLPYPTLLAHPSKRLQASQQISNPASSINPAVYTMKKGEIAGTIWKDVWEGVDRREDAAAAAYYYYCGDG